MRQRRNWMACLLCLALLIPAGCQKSVNAQDNIVFTGMVKETGEGTIVVEEIEEKDTVGFELAAVHYDESAAQTAFHAGQKVRVTALPTVAESYPVQVTAVKIEVLEEPSETVSPQETAEPETTPAPTQEMGLAYTVSFFRADGFAEGGVEFIFGQAVNADTMTISSVQHLPVLVFTDAASFRAFLEEGADYFQWDSTYGEQEAFSAAVSQYDEAFFAENDVVLLYAQETSGSNRHEIQEAAIRDGTLTVTLRRIRPEVGTDDMADWFILVRFSKDDTAGCSAWDAVVSEE